MRLNSFLFLLNGPKVCRSGCAFCLPSAVTALGSWLWADSPIQVCSKDTSTVQGANVAADQPQNLKGRFA